MFPWLFLWAPQYHFPWSGGVKQDIAPDTTAFFNAIAPSAGDGQIEKAIFEQASYGKQLGILSDIVLSLVAQDQISAAEARQAIDQLIQLNRDINTIKNMHTKHRVDTAIGILEKLQESDPEEVQRIVARFQGARPRVVAAPGDHEAHRDLATGDRGRYLVGKVLAEVYQEWGNTMSQRIGAIGAVAIMILGAEAAWPQQPADAGRAGPRAGGSSNPLIRIFDTNGDGTLSAEEIEGASAKLKALDASKDGALSGDELRRAVASGPDRRESGSDLDKPPMAKDEQEQKILSTLDATRHGPQRYANVSEADGRLLRQLTEALGARRVVELGTSTGESGLWFSLALRKTGGHLTTHDIDPGRIAVARANFKKAGVDGLITIVEGNAHETAPKNTDPIDVLFIDAEKEGYDAYLKELLPLVRPGGLIIAHNMRYPTPNARYLEAITTNPDLDTSFVLMEGAGVGITLKKR